MSGPSDPSAQRPSLCPGKTSERIVRAVLQRFAVPYWGAVYKASGAAGRVGRFESCGGEARGLVFTGESLLRGSSLLAGTA